MPAARGRELLDGVAEHHPGRVRGVLVEEAFLGRRVTVADLPAAIQPTALWMRWCGSCSSCPARRRVGPNSPSRMKANVVMTAILRSHTSSEPANRSSTAPVAGREPGPRGRTARRSPTRSQLSSRWVLASTSSTTSRRTSSPPERNCRTRDEHRGQPLLVHRTAQQHARVGERQFPPVSVPRSAAAPAPARPAACPRRRTHRERPAGHGPCRRRSLGRPRRRGSRATSCNRHNLWTVAARSPEVTCGAASASEVW